MMRCISNVFGFQTYNPINLPTDRARVGLPPVTPAVLRPDPGADGGRPKPKAKAKPKARGKNKRGKGAKPADSKEKAWNM